ncbi:cysteine desulfurase family protein [Nocardia sp. IBHARD005]|uniref:cysteine desulfurase family protein n=1 Tax=Nocardia sp. IBHARD005 TaxID=3457765 RepID=UPI0040590208
MKSAYSGPVNGAPKTVYLDHAATTPMLPAAVEAMTAALGVVGNASSLHGSGRAARRSLEEARESIAADLGARPSEVIFTSGGTESDNLAVKGIFWGRRAADPRRTRIVTSAVEHHAVLDAVEWLEKHEGAQVSWLPVDADGVVSPQVLREVLAAYADEVALVSVMWANNEVGTIEPIAELAAVAQEFGIPMHSDAIQAVTQIPVDFAASGLAALSVAGHKVGGPHGIGVLLLGRNVPCVPLVHGGGHERDLRSGTSDVAAAIGMAAALRDAVADLPARAQQLRALREALIDGVRAAVPEAVLNGPTDRLPGNAHFTFPGCEGDSLLMLLDAAGVECSTGSACNAGVASPSHVLIAMGVQPWQARSSLRFSLGHTSTAADVETLLTVLPQVIDRARAAGLAGARGGA